MTARLIALAAIAAVLCTPHAQAQRVSPMLAGKFAQICSTPRAGGTQICDAYITGMADTLTLAQAAARNQGDAKFKLDVCVPADTANAAMRGKVLAWLRAHRDRLGSPVGATIYDALHDSYPCGAAKPDGG